jgi:hypothetical protein
MMAMLRTLDGENVSTPSRGWASVGLSHVLRRLN